MNRHADRGYRRMALACPQPKRGTRHRHFAQIERVAAAANPSAQAAPKLDISSLTAQYDGTTIVATPIDAETGSGF